MMCLVAPGRIMAESVARLCHGPAMARTSRETTAWPWRSGTWRGTLTANVRWPWLSVVPDSQKGCCWGRWTLTCTRASST